jgi:hypothetical protein
MCIPSIPALLADRGRRPLGRARRPHNTSGSITAQATKPMGRPPQRARAGGGSIEALSKAPMKASCKGNTTPHVPSPCAHHEGGLVYGEVPARWDPPPRHIRRCPPTRARGWNCPGRPRPARWTFPGQGATGCHSLYCRKVLRHRAGPLEFGSDVDTGLSPQA